MRELHVFRTNRFRIHRNKFVRTTERRDFRAEVRQDFYQHIAPNGGMLINADAQTFQRIVFKEIQIAHRVIFASHGRNFMRRFYVRKISIRAKERVVQFDDLAAHALLVRLQNFTAALVKFYSIAVVRNVATCDHNRGNFIFKSQQGDRRRRNFSAVHRAITQVVGSATDRFHHAAGAGSEIATDRHAFTRALDFANGFKVLEKSLRVGVTNFIRHCRRQPARTARAKRHTAAHHEFLNGNFHKQNYLATSAFDFSL